MRECPASAGDAWLGARPREDSEGGSSLREDVPWMTSRDSGRGEDLVALERAWRERVTKCAR